METDKDILEMVYWANQAGGKGVSIGRNIFQHKNPERMVRAIYAIVFKGASLKDSLEILSR